MRRYIFADESGNFDFSNQRDATRYFAVGTIVIDGDERRQELDTKLSSLKYDLANAGIPVGGSFHATSDKQKVRDEVYSLLQDLSVTVDVTILDKKKAQPKVRPSDERFYQYAWWFHFNRIAWGLKGVEELMVVASSLGTRRKSRNFKSALENVMSQKCPSHISTRIMWWRDENDHCLQAADYMLWAVMRHKERGDDRSRNLVWDQVTSCFEPFARGTKFYY